MEVAKIEVERVLTRATGYLRTICSHSLQPYRGCPLGRSLCGVACYARHSPWVTGGREWGTFLEARENAADSYRRHQEREARWARRERGMFGVFLSSATEPFPPQEARLGVTARVLEAMSEAPPDELIVQTHTHHFRERLDLLAELSRRCRLRLHVSIETDRDVVPGLPSHHSSVERRLDAASAARGAGLFTVVTVAPLLPIEDPDRFFARIATVADAVVLDHWIEGDGSADGARTRRTRLPEIVASMDPLAATLAYRDAMVELASRHLPGRVGVHIDGFAGRWIGASDPERR